MYKEISRDLLHTREDLAAVCHLHGVDPEWIEPNQLNVVMCDECGYWDIPKRVHVLQDGTNFCFACHDLETRRF